MISTLNVYDRLELKVKGDATTMDAEEREKLQDLLIDRYVERITRVSDETLLEIAAEERIF